MTGPFPTMEASRPKPPRVRKFVIRWCSRCIAVGALAVAGSAVYLNQIGVPFFAKNWLLDGFQARGLALSFERVRVRLGRGIVAENVAVESLRLSGREKVSADELQLKLNWDSVFHFAPEIEAIHLRNGSLEIPLNETNQSLAKVLLNHADAVIRLGGTNSWVIENFDAKFQGIQIAVSGTITNTAQLWRAKKATGEPGTQWKKTLGDVAQTLASIQFGSEPKIAISFFLDPARPSASSARVTLNANQPKTPWGRADLLTADALLNPALNSNNILRASLRIRAERPETPWARAENLNFAARTEFDGTNAIPGRLAWDVHARNIVAPQGRVRTLDLSARTLAASSAPAAAALFQLPPVGRSGIWHLETSPGFQTQLELHAGGLHRTNLDCVQLDLAGELIHSTNTWHEGQFQIVLGKTSGPQLKLGGAVAALRINPEAAELAAQPENAWWNWAAPFRIHGSISATNLESRQLSLESAGIIAEYATNRLSVQRVQTKLYGGLVKASADIDIHSRAAKVEASSLFDPHALESMLTENGRVWIRQYGWPTNQPPALSGTVTGILPAWTNLAPDWRAEVLPTLDIEASLSATNVLFRGIPGDQATGHIRLKDMIWSLPDLTVTRPEGRLELGYTDEILTQRYHFRFRSTIDPRAGRDMIPGAKARQAFDEWIITTPPAVEGDIWGQWHHVDLIGLSASLSATNTSWHGEHVDRVSASISYTNQVLEVTHGEVTDGSQHGTLGRLEYQIPSQWLTFSNVLARVEPGRVTRLIGPKTHALIEPFHFAAIPFVTLEGRFDKYGGDQNDVTFKVEAPGDFEWNRIHVTAPTATVTYIGRSVIITNFSSKFYRGDLKGHLVLDVGAADSTTTALEMKAQADNVDLHAMMMGLGQGTNRLEGIVSASAHLKATDGQTPETWSGTGRASLHDGFLWDIPLVGIFTPIFRTVAPDWGQARFTAATATFKVADGKIYSSDLELKSSSMKLDYSGAVDLKGNLDAMMRAEMFRKVPVLGPIASIALSPFEKLFEYKLTGSLKQPKAEPAYIPSFLLAPFHPIQTIKGLIPSEKKTNDPPAQ